MHSVTTMPDAAGAARPTGMTWIPGGEFTMRPDAFYPEERPVRPVAVDSFWTDTRPVTVADFRRFATVADYRAVAEPPLRADEDPDADVGRRDRHRVTDVADPDEEAQGEAVGTDGRWAGGAAGTSRSSNFAGRIGFRCVIQSGPLLARPGPRPATEAPQSAGAAGRAA